MKKEILIYTAIYSFTAKEFVEALNDATNGATIRINSPGGSVFGTWAMITKLKEYAQKHSVDIKVDGLAASMAAFLLPYFNNVVGSSLSKYMIHRADTFVDNEDDRNMLIKINADLRAQLEKKLNVERFVEITGVTLDEIFALENRKEVYLSAEQAEQVGLISEVKNIDVTASSRKGIFSVAAVAPEESPKAEQTKNNNSLNTNVMTLEEFKAKHPEIFAQAQKAGEVAERDRVGAWMVFVDADQKAVAEGIKGGEALSATTQAELSRKLLSATALKEEESESPKDVVAETEEEKAARLKAEALVAKGEKTETDFMAAFRKESGIEAKK